MYHRKKARQRKMPAQANLKSLHIFEKR